MKPDEDEDQEDESACFTARTSLCFDSTGLGGWRESCGCGPVPTSLLYYYYYPHLFTYTTRFCFVLLLLLCFAFFFFPHSLLRKNCIVRTDIFGLLLPHVRGRIRRGEGREGLSPLCSALLYLCSLSLLSFVALLFPSSLFPTCGCSLFSLCCCALHARGKSAGVRIAGGSQRGSYFEKSRKGQGREGRGERQDELLECADGIGIEGEEEGK